MEISAAISSTEMELAEVETSLEEVCLDDASKERSQDAESTANISSKSKKTELHLTREIARKAAVDREEATSKAASKMQSRATHRSVGNLEKGIPDWNEQCRYQWDPLLKGPQMQKDHCVLAFLRTQLTSCCT
jgi:hypothetical protein